MSKADLLAKAEELGIPTKNEDGKDLTVAELKAAISEKEESGVDEENKESNESNPESEPEANPESEQEAEPEAEPAKRTNPVKTQKSEKDKTFREKIEETIPKLVDYMNGKFQEEKVKSILKELVE